MLKQKKQKKHGPGLDLLEQKHTECGGIKHVCERSTFPSTCAFGINAKVVVSIIGNNTTSPYVYVLVKCKI